MRRLTALFVVVLCASTFAQPPAPLILRAARWLDVAEGHQGDGTVSFVMKGGVVVRGPGVQ
jgi:hypothetical protein